jgi:CheY-like chemotaxis protein
MHPGQVSRPSDEQVAASDVPRVLVADADADTRSLYRAVLQASGCEVLEAVDGREALTIALLRPPTLVMSELRLPNLDGFALCELLRRDPATAEVPIVIITTESRPAEVIRAKLLAAEVLIKPTTPGAVVTAITRVLARSLVGENIETPRPAAEPRTAVRPLAGSGERRRRVQAKSVPRFTTTAPPTPPPSLQCPSCDRALTYERSYIGGVNARNIERWDYFRCVPCGIFQYRHRTRKLRRVDDFTSGNGTPKETSNEK